MVSQAEQKDSKHHSANGFAWIVIRLSRISCSGLSLAPVGTCAKRGGAQCRGQEAAASAAVRRLQ